MRFVRLILQFCLFCISASAYPQTCAVNTYPTSPVKYTQGDPVVNVVQPTNPVLMTLYEAILLALRFNPTVQSADLQRVVQKFSLRVAFWNFQVHYSLTGSANYTNSVSGGVRSESDNQNLIPGMSLLTGIGTQLNLQSSNPVSHSAGSTRFYNPAVTLNITQPLIQGITPDVVLAPLHTAQYQECLNRLSFRSTIMQTITTVISQYAAVAQAQNSIEAQKISLQNAIATLKQQEAFLKTGRIAAADLVQFQTSVATQQLGLEQQEVNLMQQKRSLLVTLGIDPATPIQVTKQVKFRNECIPSLQESIELGLRANIPYQQAKINVQLARIALRVAQDQQNWVLNLTASRTQGGGSGGSPNSGIESLFNGYNNNTTVGLNLTVPIDNLSLQQTLLSAQVALKQACIQLAAQKRLVENDVINAYNTVISQRQQIKQAKMAVDLAQRSLDIANAKLLFGKVSAFEVSTLQTNLVTQQLTYINTLTAYVISLAALDQILAMTMCRWKINICQVPYRQC